MSKTFREWPIDQAWLLPASVQEMVPDDHLAHFIRDTIRGSMDLRAIHGAYTEGRGYPPYHPTMMTALLLYAYCRGVYSSRGIATGCQERLDFMAVTAMQKPDFRTVSEFRRRHLDALAGLFVQVLKLCEKAKIVRLGHVAIDSTPLQANASKESSMSYGRMKSREQALKEEIAKWFEKAEKTDQEEDKLYGTDKRGDELPAWVVSKTERLKRIQAAKAEIEAEAKALYEKRRDEKQLPAGQGGTHRPKPKETPSDKAQLNFTDKESKMLKTRNGFIQGYRCQLAVDAGHQVIVACDASADGDDHAWLLPLITQVRKNLGRNPKEVSADTGYCSEANLKALKRRRLNAYIAPERRHKGALSKKRKYALRSTPATVEMRRKLQRGGYRSRYRLRKQTVEPVIGQIKEPRGFLRFSLRGVKKVRSEWSLVCAAHNLLKLSKQRSKLN